VSVQCLLGGCHKPRTEAASTTSGYLELKGGPLANGSSRGGGRQTGGMSFADFAANGGGGARRGIGHDNGGFGGVGGGERNNGGPAGGSDAADAFSRESKRVASAIFQMTTNVAAFKRGVDAVGTPKDSREMRGKLNRQRETLGAQAKETSAAVKRLTDLAASRQNDPQVKAQHSKLVKDFQAVLTEFQKTQKRCAEKESTFMPPADTGSATMVPLESYQRGGDLDERASLLQAQKRQEMIQIESELEFNNAIIEERETGIAEIQAQIGEVNEIFQDLAILVNEQGQMIDDIESNIVSTAAKTKTAQKELTKADRNQKSARNKMFCLLMVFAIVITIIFIALFAGS